MSDRPPSELSVAITEAGACPAGPCGCAAAPCPCSSPCSRAWPQHGTADLAWLPPVPALQGAQRLQLCATTPPRQQAPSSAMVWHAKWMMAHVWRAADVTVQRARHTGVGSAPLVLPGTAQQDKTRQGRPGREPPAPLPACHQMHCWWPAAARRCQPPCWSWSGAAGTTRGQAAHSGPRSGAAGGQQPRHREPRWSTPAARTVQ